MREKEGARRRNFAEDSRRGTVRFMGKKGSHMVPGRVDRPPVLGLKKRTEQMAPSYPTKRCDKVL